MPQREHRRCVDEIFLENRRQKRVQNPGIKARQRSTPDFIAEVEKKCLHRFDETQSPEAVIRVLQNAIQKLRAGIVDRNHLIERNRVSKPLEGYTQDTQSVAALERARDQEISIHPGQDIEYVVVDDEKSSRERVNLAHETTDAYDPDYYETQLVRAVESVLSPVRWKQADIQQALCETQNSSLNGFRETL